MNKRLMVQTLCSVLLLLAPGLSRVWSDELKTIQTHKTKDVIVTLRSPSGQWTQGNNNFVLDFTAAATQQPVEAGQVTLSTSMPMPGMAPMLAGAILKPDKVPGRYLGTGMGPPGRVPHASQCLCANALVRHLRAHSSTASCYREPCEALSLHRERVMAMHCA